MDNIVIFDTTLRDGDQAKGFHFKPQEKIEIARQLVRLGVDVIEAGFGASGKDYEVVDRISREFGTSDGPIMCSLARTNKKDIEYAARAIERAKKKRIHTFIATSDIHLNDKLKKSKEQVIEMAVSAVRMAKNSTNDVEFSCEDFGRTDLDYAADIISEAIKAGATTINLPDTVGWMYPSETYERVKSTIDRVRSKGLDAIFSVHNHNDLGMATANTIEGIRAGARQVEVTMNGIGERAGNTALEEVVAAILIRKLGNCGINTKLIGETSRLVAKYSSKPQPNKAIVGANAFSHEAGIHQDGMIKSQSTYEIMRPEDFGVESVITLGPRSGRRGINQGYQQIGINLGGQELNDAVDRFKVITEEKKEADHADLVLALGNDPIIPERFKFVGYHPISVNGKVKVLVDIEVDGNLVHSYGKGNGQIDAIRKAIMKDTAVYFDIEDYHESSESPGSSAVGLTRMKIARNGWRVYGLGEDTDVVRSAAKAMIDGCNRISYVQFYFSRR